MEIDCVIYDIQADTKETVVDLNVTVEHDRS